MLFFFVSLSTQRIRDTNRESLSLADHLATLYRTSAILLPSLYFYPVLFQTNTNLSFSIASQKSFKMSTKKSRKGKRNRTQRYTSNVFAMFNQAQIQEFKEAFNMIDQNHDGYVDKDDLIEIQTSLGKNPTEDEADLMINMAPGPINFTMFLTLFGEKLNGTDPEDVIKNAFACFDFENSGHINEDYLRECLVTMGDRWSDEMVDDLFHGAPIQAGKFDYMEFTRTLKHGAKDENPTPPQPQQISTTES